LKIGVFVPTGEFNPQFQIEGVAHTNHSYCHKTRANDLLFGVRTLAQLSFVLSQITRLTDGQTEGQTAFSWLDSACIACSAAKTGVSMLGLCITGQ